MNSKVFTVHQLITIYVHENKNKKNKVNTVNSFHQKSFYFLFEVAKSECFNKCVYRCVYIHFCFFIYQQIQSVILCY